MSKVSIETSQSVQGHCTYQILLLLLLSGLNDTNSASRPQNGQGFNLISSIIFMFIATSLTCLRKRFRATHDILNIPIWRVKIPFRDEMIDIFFELLPAVEALMGQILGAYRIYRPSVLCFRDIDQVIFTVCFNAFNGVCFSFPERDIGNITHIC